MVLIENGSENGIIQMYGIDGTEPAPSLYKYLVIYEQFQALAALAMRHGKLVHHIALTSKPQLQACKQQQKWPQAQCFNSLVLNFLIHYTGIPYHSRVKIITGL